MTVTTLPLLDYIRKQPFNLVNKFNCLPILAVLLLTGCAEIDYAPYVGTQHPWPTQPGGFAKQYNEITVFHGLPSRPYNVLGRAIGADVSDRQLVWLAHTNGADAVMIVDAKTFDAGSASLPGASFTTLTGNTISTYRTPSFSVPMTTTITTAWLIKFKTPEQFKQDEDRALLLEVERYHAWALEHPNGGSLPNAATGQDQFIPADQVAKILTNSARLQEELTASKRLDSPKGKP